MGLFEKMMGFADRYRAESGLSDKAARQAEEQSPRERELMAELGAPGDGRQAARYALRFTGDVQGVGFRWTNQNLAQDRHLTGWVRNLDDGSVVMEIQGPPQRLAAHFERVHAYYSRFGNRIWLESAHELEPIADEKGFDVRV